MAAGTRGWVFAAAWAALALAAGTAEGGIINPSFETGDLSGWTALTSWTILADGGSDGLHYASMLSPEPEPPGGPSIPPDENQGWATAIEQFFTMPGWAETLSIDIRNEGLNVTVHLSQEGAVPFNPINILDGTASQAPNGFTRYTAAVSQYAGLDVRLTVNVSADDVPPARLRTSVDNVLVVPEPSTLALLMVWMTFAVARRPRGL
jgi:hypothetical protein